MDIETCTDVLVDSGVAWIQEINLFTRMKETVTKRNMMKTASMYLTRIFHQTGYSTTRLVRLFVKMSFSKFEFHNVQRADTTTGLIHLLYFPISPKMILVDSSRSLVVLTAPHGFATGSKATEYFNITVKLNVHGLKSKKISAMTFMGAFLFDIYLALCTEFVLFFSRYILLSVSIDYC